MLLAFTQRIGCLRLPTEQAISPRELRELFAKGLKAEASHQLIQNGEFYKTAARTREAQTALPVCSGRNINGTVGRGIEDEKDDERIDVHNDGE